MLLATPLLFCLALLEAQHGSECITNYKDFRVPISIDPGLREQIEKIRVFVSTDRGKTWKKLTSVSVDQKSFDFHAPEDGIYLFKVQNIFKDKHVDPKDISGAPIALKVLVRTTNAKSPEEEIAALREQVESLEKELTAVRSKLSELEKKVGKSRP